MQFILTSSSYVVMTSWLQHLSLSPKGATAVFIDTAADMYNKAEEEWLQVDRRALVDHGFSVSDYSLVNKSKKQVFKDLAEIDLIFVAGGNTFFLLEHAQKSGFVELIQENAFPNAVYVGSSAGSVLLCDDIAAIQFLDNPKEASLTSTKAIGFFQSLIFPHWGSPHFKSKYAEAFRYVYTHGISVTTLTDKQYIVGDGTSFTIHTI